MCWTEITRIEHDRSELVYASDCRDLEWSIIAPFVDVASKVGRPRSVNIRRVWEATQYIAATGCQWRLLPRDFPAVSTVRYYFYKWRDQGLFELINQALSQTCRLMSDRDAQPTGAVIDSQSMKTTESGGPKGYDAGKKVKGRKRHIITDTQGNLLYVQVHKADMQDRQAAFEVIMACLLSFPGIAKIFADAGYAGDKLAVSMLNLDPSPEIEIVKRPNHTNGFVVVARRWVVERTLAWLGRCRRLAKDWEKTIASSEAWTLIAAIRRSTRLIARKVKAGVGF